MAVEEQTLYNSITHLYAGSVIRHGQRLTIPNRKVTKLAFITRKLGSPTGAVTFTIRKVSDDSIILSKVWGDASALTIDYVWVEVIFDTPATINEEVRILVEFSGGSINNDVLATYQNTDVKAGEVTTAYTASYTDYATNDSTYRYTYEVGEKPRTAQIAAKMVGAGVI